LMARDGRKAQKLAARRLGPLNHKSGNRVTQLARGLQPSLKNSESLIAGTSKQNHQVSSRGPRRSADNHNYRPDKTALDALLSILLSGRRQIRQVAPRLLRAPQSIATQKRVVHQESEIVRLQRHPARRLAIEQRDQFHRSRSPPPQVAH
jgi:hypothetical protein